MGVRVLHDRQKNYAALYCSTTGWAFGPIFHETTDAGAEERAQAFLDWLGVSDPRLLSDPALEQKYSEWLIAETKTVLRRGN